eukprot:TRINITY_DN6960_c0_g1_i3.p1 TRINITY_DN6960_c0_g1~~TRINITY_DN6960_c0_g1_i3.p1  ORF type:complete len:591 (-),score=136.28 TRINITY_DN6960_c0_g1_i3:87-1793(-)
MCIRDRDHTENEDDDDEVVVGVGEDHEDSFNVVCEPSMNSGGNNESSYIQNAEFMNEESEGKPGESTILSQGHANVGTPHSPNNPIINQRGSAAQSVILNVSGGNSNKNNNNNSSKEANKSGDHLHHSYVGRVVGGSSSKENSATLRKGGLEKSRSAQNSVIYKGNEMILSFLENKGNSSNSKKAILHTVKTPPASTTILSNENLTTHFKTHAEADNDRGDLREIGNNANSAKKKMFGKNDAKDHAAHPYFGLHDEEGPHLESQNDVDVLHGQLCQSEEIDYPVDEKHTQPDNPHLLPLSSGDELSPGRSKRGLERTNSARQSGMKPSQFPVKVTEEGDVSPGHRDLESGTVKIISRSDRTSFGQIAGSDSNPDAILDESGMKNINKKTNSNESFYIEKRYCTVCNIEQPIRSKHCRECQRCAGTYDHHCPWLGTCIAEKNRCNFFGFLIFQFIELAWAWLKLVSCMWAVESNQWLVDNWQSLVCVLTISFFLVMVGMLIGYHVFLMVSNLTTWENLSWHKISYLREWPEEAGSPFDTGMKDNVMYYCCYRDKSLKKWVVPRYTSKDQ